MPVGALGPFFRIGFGSDFFRSWGDFGRFRGGQNGPKIDFGEVFFEVVFECVSAAFFVNFLRFFEVRTLIFVRTASVSEHVHKIDSFFKK